MKRETKLKVCRKIIKEVKKNLKDLKRHTDGQFLAMDLTTILDRHCLTTNIRSKKNDIPIKAFFNKLKISKQEMVDMDLDCDEDEVKGKKYWMLDYPAKYLDDILDKWPDKIKILAVS